MMFYAFSVPDFFDVFLFYAEHRSSQIDISSQYYQFRRKISKAIGKDKFSC